MDAHGALFGHPVDHSRSPGIYRAFAARTGRRFGFELIECPPGSLRSAVTAFAGRRGAVGANITVPHKLDALALADAASARARLAGAANTLRFEPGGSVFADNTDGAGLVADLSRLRITVASRRVLVLGAGGAARGIVGPLLDLEPALLVVANRHPDRAAVLVERYRGRAPIASAALDDPGDDYHLVINATSTSLAGTVPGVPPALFAGGALAYDLAYADDGVTAFTRWASAHGSAAVHDGWGMLVEQAAASWEIWFGERPATGPLHDRGSYETWGEQ